MAFQGCLTSVRFRVIFITTSLTDKIASTHLVDQMSIVWLQQVSLSWAATGFPYLKASE
jgi:hypothetical protein